MRRLLIHAVVGIAVPGIVTFGQHLLPITVGTGVLTGVVVTDDETPVPVRRATVRIVDGETVSPRLAGTDDRGRFTFEGLPTGRYTVAALKGGFIETFHGARRPGRGPGVPVAVTRGGTATVSLTLVRGGVITGVVTAESGQPAPGVMVAAVGFPSAGGLPAASALLRTETDDRGQYRLFGLAPGSYLISVVSRLAQASSAARGGAGTMISGLTDAEAAWAAAGNPTRLLPLSGRAVAYAPTFYPGTNDAGAAAPIVVRAGREESGINITLRPVPVATVSGRITTADGQTISTSSVTMHWSQRQGESAVDLVASSAVAALPRASTTPPHFAIVGVWPGDYTLVARSSGGQRGAQPPNPVPLLWGIQNIRVDGADLAGIHLQLLPGLELTGAIQFQGSTPRPAPDTFEVALRPQGLNFSGVSAIRALMTAEGSVRFPSIPPGRFLAESTISGGWFLESFVADGRDLSELPLDVTAMGGAKSGAVLTFSDQPARVDGALVDDTGAGVTRYAVVLFPVDKARWQSPSRRVRLVQPATDGSFAIRNLPAGDYMLAAAQDVTFADLDATLFAELSATGVKVSLTRGQRTRHTLKVVR